MTIKATNSARINTNIIPYLITIPLLCRFCFNEYNGARICLEGRNQKSPVAYIRSIYGTSRGIASMKRRKCPIRISELYNENSITFTMNSRAGWLIACAPSPRPYHLPVHHARFVSSCLNSRERKTEIKILWIALSMNITAIIPSTAWDPFQSSRNHCKKKKRKKKSRT